MCASRKLLERVRWTFIPQIYTYNNGKQEIISKLGRRSAQQARISHSRTVTEWLTGAKCGGAYLYSEHPGGWDRKIWISRPALANRRKKKRKEKKGSKDSLVDFVNAGKLKLCIKKRRKEILFTVHLSAYKVVSYIGKTLRQTGPRVKRQ